MLKMQLNIVYSRILFLYLKKVNKYIEKNILGCKFLRDWFYFYVFVTCFIITYLFNLLIMKVVENIFIILKLNVIKWT